MAQKRKRVSRWRRFDLPFGFKAIERRGGIYALFDSEERLLYLGSSGNVRARVVTHCATHRQVCSIKVSYMRGAWYRREQRLIRRLRPLLNLRLTFRNRRSPNCR